MYSLDLDCVNRSSKRAPLDLKGSVAAAQKSCRYWIKQTIVLIVDSFYCFVSIVSRSIVSIQLD